MRKLDNKEWSPKLLALIEGAKQLSLGELTDLRDYISGRIGGKRQEEKAMNKPIDKRKSKKYLSPSGHAVGRAKHFDEIDFKY